MACYKYIGHCAKINPITLCVMTANSCSCLIYHVNANGNYQTIKLAYFAMSSYALMIYCPFHSLSALTLIATFHNLPLQTFQLLNTKQPFNIPLSAIALSLDILHISFNPLKQFDPILTHSIHCNSPI